MRRISLKAGLAALCLSVTAFSASAFDMSNMSEDERASFRAEIRAYLLENPEVLMEAVGVLEARQAAEQAQVDVQIIANNAAALFDNPDSWVGGNPDGDVTLVEFIDYRCGFCRRAHPEVAELLESDGNIRLIVKEFPILGEESVLASRFALSAKLNIGDAAYKTVHDALIAMRGAVTMESLGRLARDLRLDGDTIIAGMEDPEINDILNTNQELARALGITGTPTFVLETELLRGYLPLEGMREVIEDAREAG